MLILLKCWWGRICGQGLGLTWALDSGFDGRIFIRSVWIRIEAVGVVNIDDSVK